MAVTINPTQDDVVDVVIGYLASAIPGVQVTAGQVNRVAEPAVDNFVVIWPRGRTRLSTNVDGLSGSLTMQATQNVDLLLQMDVHGSLSADYAQIITTLLRDGDAVRFFAESGVPCAPLHADDPKQVPFVNAENQFEDRWIVEAHIQANQTVSAIPQQSAIAANIKTIEVDAAYPP